MVVVSSSGKGRSLRVSPRGVVLAREWQGTAENGTKAAGGYWMMCPRASGHLGVQSVLIARVRDSVLMW